MSEKSNFCRILEFPRELTSIIFENLHLSDKLCVRASCSSLHYHIDEHIRRKIIQWIKKVETCERKLSHDKILLVSIEQYLRKNFTPPYVESLIEMTESIAKFSTDPWNDIKVPSAIERREKLLKFFYEQANEKFTEIEKKISFVLTLLEMLKSLCDSQFTSVHPFNRKAMLRLSFSISNLFFCHSVL